MRQKRLLLAALAALVVALPLAAVVLLPHLLDLNRYRDTIAAVASERLGRSVTIAGPVRLTLWPAPELTAEQVDVGGDSAFHVAALRLRVGLRPLLAGRIEPRELVLRGADLRLPWPLPQSVLASRPPPWLGAFAARVEGGTLRLGELTVTDIDATISQGKDGLLGTSGTARLNARAARFTLRLGTPGDDGAAALDMSLDGIDAMSGAGASFSGAVAADGSLAGHLMARGNDLSLLVAAPSIAFKAEGRLTAGDGLVAMDEATFDLGGAPASGALALRLTPVVRLDVALSATRLDLDPWLTALLPAKGKAPIGSALPVGADLAVEAAYLGGGLVQRLRARADTEGGVVHLSDVSAILPGEAQLQMDGTIDAGTAGAPQLAATVRVTAPELRRTLDWLKQSGLAKLPMPPDAALRTASFTAKLHLQPGSFALDDLRGQVDGAAVAASLRLLGGAHPGFVVDVATDNLTLDPWLPADSLADALASPERWLVDGGPKTLIGGPTGQVSVRAENATLDGVPIAGFVLDAAAGDGRLALNELDGTAGGLRVGAAGVVDQDGRLTAVKVSLHGATGKPLANLFPSTFATPALWRGPVALEIRGGGPPSALALGIALDLGDARLEAQPVIDLRTRAWRASASLRHPSAVRLLGMLGVAAPPAVPGAEAWLGDGSLSLIGQFAQTPAPDGWGRLSADGFTVTAGALRAGGQLTVAGKRVAGTITADVLPVPLPEAGSDVPMPLPALRGWQGAVAVRTEQVVAGPADLADHAAFTVTLGDDVLTIDDFRGQIDGGTLAGSASLNIGASPFTLTAAATVHDTAIRAAPDNAPIGLLSGRLDGTATVTASGYSPAAMLATLAGSLDATVRDGALVGFDLFGAARAIGNADAQGPSETEENLRTALQDGTTSFDRLNISGQAAHGLLRLKSVQLQGAAGSAEAHGSIDLTDGTMDVQVALTPSIQGAPAVGLRLDGLLAAPTHQPELAAASRWLAERPATR